VIPAVLQEILAHKRREVAEARDRYPEEALRERAAIAPPARDFAAALRRREDEPRPRVIAEIKRASPSAGTIRADADPGAIAVEYEAAGAAAISVLTDRRFFDGDLLHLVAARSRVGIPILRKDFVIDPYQIVEARAAGADAILLIVAALEDEALVSLHAAARAAGLHVLVEVHDESEAERAVLAGATIVGVNHRDLRTMKMDMSLFARLRPALPAGAIAVAESGIRTAEDVRRLAAAGADAILVGERLMREPSPGAALRELFA
jgi:indole-3-glycerol phosphate synthase